MRVARRLVLIGVTVAASAVLAAGQPGPADLFRLLTFDAGRGPRLGATRGDGAADVLDVHNAVRAMLVAGVPAGRDLPYVPADMRTLLEAGPDAIAAVKRIYDTSVELQRTGTLADPGGAERVFHTMTSIRVLPPVPNPSKIFGFAGNYPREGALANPEYPSAFFKSVAALVGHGDAIELGPLVTTGVHEPELSVVIGRRTRHVSEAEALDYVAGYTICNDVTARDLPKGTHPSQGSAMDKGLDTFSPCGPFLTLREDVPDPHDLAIAVRLNGEAWTIPNANTRHLVFKVPYIIAFLSARITLVPGDIVQTGVPAPVVPLRVGDTVEMTIGHLGTLRNQVVADRTSSR